MNRRDFMRGLAIFGLTPLLPLPSIGTASSGSVAVAATAEKMYFMGWYTSRLSKTCSPDFLIKELNVQPDVANDIFAKLVETNTVSTPNALGVSRIVEPLSDSYRRVTGKLARKAVGEKRRVVKRDDLTREEPVVEDRAVFEEDQSEELEAGEETLDLVESDAPEIELETVQPLS